MLGRRPPRILDRPGPRESRAELTSAYERLPVEWVVGSGLAARSLAVRDVFGSDRRKARRGLAALLYGQQLLPDDLEQAGTLLFPLLSRLREDELIACANALIQSGRLADATRALAHVPSRTLSVAGTHADLLNPFRNGDEHLADWLDTFGALFASYQLEPVTLRDARDDEPPFDRLNCEVLDRVDGPLVSVIMTTYRPQRETFEAVRSILEQTWHNLELLVIDDGSPAEFDGVLVELAALDARVRVIRNSDNRGTYVRRNQAIDVALGEFVTMHDSDDWAHPRRIELQATWLVEHPDAPGNVSLCIRATPDLMLFQQRGLGARVCEPALLFRRETVVAAAGYFDPVRRGADSEFRRRVNLVFDTPVHVLEDSGPLTVQRLEPVSLSGSDIRPGWVHEARTAYSSNFLFWHRQIAAGGASGRLDPTAPRPFAAPAHMLGAPVEDRSLDVLYLVDLVVRVDDKRDFGPLARQILALAELGLTVGVAHAWSVGRESEPEQRYADEIQHLFTEGTVSQVMLGDRSRARLGIVPDASALQFPSVLHAGVRLERFVAGISLGEAPHHPGGGVYLRADCDDSAAAQFGVTLEWLEPDEAYAAAAALRD
jgi:O-antigen biosynthesis protein